MCWSCYLMQICCSSTYCLCMVASAHCTCMSWTALSSGELLCHARLVVELLCRLVCTEEYMIAHSFCCSGGSWLLLCIISAVLPSFMLHTEYSLEMKRTKQSLVLFIYIYLGRDGLNSLACVGTCHAKVLDGILSIISRRCAQLTLLGVH